MKLQIKLTTFELLEQMIFSVQRQQSEEKKIVHDEFVRRRQKNKREEQKIPK